MQKQKTALVLGAGGFIGHHMVARLKAEGYWVRGVDVKKPRWSQTVADEFIEFDLRNKVGFVQLLITPFDSTFDEIYQFAADMGGADYVFSGKHDADVMYSSGQINLNLVSSQVVLNDCYKLNKTKIFYSSSACVYPKHNQLDPDNPNCVEDSAYPADPDSDYGLEKLFSERLFLAYCRNYGIPVRVARYHNIFGPESDWEGERAKSPAAICRKVILSGETGGIVPIYGDGEQTRSFLYIDQCIEATRRFMESDFMGPVNIGSEEMITINNLAKMAASFEDKDIKIEHISGPLGVRGRNSDKTLYEKMVGPMAFQPLRVGLRKTYDWIKDQVKVKYFSQVNQE